MLLCDIGNTSCHFYDLKNDHKQSIKHFDPASIREDVYYICVEPTLKKKLVDFPNWHDLEKRVDRKRYYDTMGIDRIMACEAVYSGVIVDAGSAITVDVMQEGEYKGGFIYPGIRAFQRAYASISKALDYDIETDIDLTELPKDTFSALSYGFLSGIIKEITSYGLDIFLTGGDAKKLYLHLRDAKMKPLLIFEGMLFTLV